MIEEQREGGQPEGLAPFSDRSDAYRVDTTRLNTDQEPRQAKTHKRVRVYIDGFNLYHAIASLNIPDLKWLNFWALSQSFLRQGEILDEVNLFTAVLTWNHDKQQRHVNFLKACRAVGVRVHEANFKQSHRLCTEKERRCKFYEEKQTDVAIAVKMISDAMTGSFYRAILVTADSDQIPTAKFIAAMPDRQLSVIFPPGRGAQARELGAAIPDRKELSPGQMRTCRLPRTVHDKKGKVVAHMPALYLRHVRISN